MIRPWYWPRGGQPYRTEPFTWIVKGVMAVSWWPDEPVMERYRGEGIKVIINASEFDYRNSIEDEFRYYHIDIPDFGVPTKPQIDRFLEITSEHGAQKDPIVVHCVAGCGRTGQLIVVWAAYNGHIPAGADPVDWIRARRPCCLETGEQMAFARTMAEQYWKKE